MRFFLFIFLIIILNPCKGEYHLRISPKSQAKIDHDIKKIKRSYRLSNELINYRGDLILHNKRYKVQIDIHGDLSPHWRNSTYRSYDIKLNDDETIQGMNQFLLIRADDKDHELEKWAHNLSQKLRLPYLKVQTVKLKVDTHPIKDYILYQKLDKSFLEHNGIAGSFVIKQDNAWKLGIDRKDSKLYNPYISKDIRSQEDQLNPLLYKIYPLNSLNLGNETILKKFESFLKTPKELDLDVFTDYLALVALTGSFHSILHDNLRWIYKPWTGQFYPIFYDVISRPLPQSFSEFSRELSRLNIHIGNIISHFTLKKVSAKTINKIMYISKHFEINSKVKANLQKIETWPEFKMVLK